jgi:hypothetical protein
LRGAPKKVFGTKYFSAFALGAYDVSSDGQRFLMIKEERAADDAPKQDRIVVVLNWTEELKRRMQSQ